MNKLVLATATMVVVGAAVAGGLVWSGPVRVAVQRAVSPGPLSPRHGYLAARCEVCHEPWVGVTVATCTPCHAASPRLLGRQPTAFHASIEECATCHVEHQGTGIRPARMDHAALARIGARTLQRASARDPDSAATLASLQTWLRVEGPAQLDERAAREALDCAGCHDRRDPHVKKFGSDCAQCHGFATWKVRGYLHPSPRNRECGQCHQAPPSHFMEHFAMISQTFARKEHAGVDQCFECHNTTSWNDIVDVGYYKHH